MRFSFRQPFPADADLLTAFQPELFFHHSTEMCLMPQNVARHSLDVFQDQVLSTASRM